ncbi:hypothetical protein [Polymorphospora rubra]|uniref:Uncharacterized protein n=1 Tax=Polymorphospora rubra TaxID=338584 RepID=A0A810MUH0_9ACTN|nr:hypothetical protein [Polymorphospora rubra]BCJ63085.1 hypothetical protein Prubr_01060 [Polymorphospora rubra]
MGHRSGGWAWSKVGAIHGADATNAVACDGDIHSYRYRYRCSAPSDSSYERCVGLAWCSTCREYSGAMVFVPRAEHLPDLLADLPPSERERLARSEVRLLDYLDRLVRRGTWPAVGRGGPGGPGSSSGECGHGVGSDPPT